MAKPVKFTVEQEMEYISHSYFNSRDGDNKLVRVTLGGKRFEVVMIGDGKLKFDDFKEDQGVIVTIEFTEKEVDRNTYFRAFVTGVRPSV